MNCKYRVEFWESERGWGRRLDYTKDYDSYEEAKKAQDDFNSRNTEDVVPDWYMFAEKPYLVDLDV